MKNIFKNFKELVIKPIKIKLLWHRATKLVLVLASYHNKQLAEIEKIKCEKIIQELKIIKQKLMDLEGNKQNFIPSKEFTIYLNF